MAAIGSHTVRTLASAVAPLVGWQTVLKSTPSMLLPFYHVVSDQALPHIRNYPYRNTTQFEAELDFLLRHYRPVALHDLLSESPGGKHCFHLSFDDGLRECAEIVAPILMRKGIPATFFVNPAFVGNRKLFHRYKASLLLSHSEKFPTKTRLLKQEGISFKTLLQTPYHQQNKLDEIARNMELSFDDFLHEQKPYMEVDQLRQLMGQGFTLGAHSWDHPEFWLIGEAEQRNQMVKSLQWLKETLNPTIEAFAFPYTDTGVADTLIAALHREGVCRLSFGTAGVKQDTIAGHWQRFACETPLPVATVLKRELVYYHMRRRLGKSYVNRNSNGAA